MSIILTVMKYTLILLFEISTHNSQVGILMDFQLHFVQLYLLYLKKLLSG